MNAASSRTDGFAGLIQRFFLQRLIQQRNASPDTVAAYRDTFRLLLNYLEQHRHKSPENLSLDDFDAPVVSEQLTLGFALDPLARDPGPGAAARSSR